MQPKLVRTNKSKPVDFIPGKPSWSALHNPERYSPAETHGANGDDPRALHIRMAQYRRMMQGE